MNDKKDTIYSENHNNKINKSEDEFMQKLEDNLFDIREPYVSEEFNPTPEFIEQTVSNYRKLLESGLVSLFDEESTMKDKNSSAQKTRK